MKLENIIAAAVLGTCVILASYVHGCMTRYAPIISSQHAPLVTDRRTGVTVVAKSINDRHGVTFIGTHTNVVTATCDP